MENIERLIERIDHSPRPSRITVLTGAGISAESGIPTFRGASGLWENYRPEELATPEAFARDPGLVWRWYEWRRELIRKAQPNNAHRALAAFEAETSSAVPFTIVTQNVDGLHLRAGSRDVIELHGNIFRARCTRDGARAELPDPLAAIPPKCACGAMLRPDIVWFGESVDLIGPAMDVTAESDVLIVIGTSGAVYPAAGLVSLVRRGLTIEINPDQTEISLQFAFSIRGSATAATPPILEAFARRLR